MFSVHSTPTEQVFNGLGIETEAIMKFLQYREFISMGMGSAGVETPEARIGPLRGFSCALGQVRR